MRLYAILRRYVGEAYEWDFLRNNYNVPHMFANEAAVRAEYARMVREETEQRAYEAMPNCPFVRFTPPIDYRIVIIPMQILEGTDATHPAADVADLGGAPGVAEAGGAGAPAAA